ncbi:hypothetical protein GCM10027296_06600 [Chitinimonas naiadis]
MDFIGVDDGKRAHRGMVLDTTVTKALRPLFDQGNAIALMHMRRELMIEIVRSQQFQSLKPVGAMESDELVGGIVCVHDLRHPDDKDIDRK